MCDFCKPSCLLESYMRTISLAELRIAPEDRDDRVKYVQFHIYFGDFHTHRYTEFPAMSMQSVIGSIGGVMGFCLGTTLILIACIEMVAFLFKLVSQRCAKRNGKVGPDSDGNEENGLEIVLRPAAVLAD